MKKKILLCILALLLILCVLVACHDTPPTGGGNDASQGGGTTDGGTTEGDNTGGTTPPPADPVPMVKDRLNGKNAKELYDDIDIYFSSVVNATMTVNLRMAVEQGENRIVVKNETISKISGNDSYTKTKTETLGETSITEETYIDGLLYINDGESKIVQAVDGGFDFDIEDDTVQIEEDNVKSMTLYEFEGAYYLLLELDESIFNDMLEGNVPEGVEAAYEELSCRIDLTNEGTFIALELLIKASAILDEDPITYDFSVGMAVSDVGRTLVTAPADADEYEFYEDPTSETVTITFKYVDQNGNPMEYVEDGSTGYSYTVDYGDYVIAPALVDDIQAFEDYVILGWDSDNDGEPDELWEFPEEDMTVYSVVREKAFFNVTFYRDDGITLYKSILVKEGTGIGDYHVGKPVELGKYFKSWVKVSGESSTVLFEDECVFKATYGITDGTIGKVARGTIEVDGIKEPAYASNGAYLPLNAMQQADHVPWQGYNGTNTDDIENGGHRGVPTVKADTYLVWDGEDVYMFIEVYDKTLVGRSAVYTQMVADAYLNDAVEVWYCFEQKTGNAGNSFTRIGIGGVRYYNDLAEQYETLCYASPRSSGIGGGRSTHYDETLVAVRSALDTYDDPAFDGVFDPEGKTKPSYVVEIAFPAYTEGKADISVAGIDKATGRKPGVPSTSNFPEDYAFTNGAKLQAGDVVRFNLQINDLMLSPDDISGLPGATFEDCPAGVLGHGTYLFYVDDLGDLLTDPYTGKPLEATSSDDAMFGTFSAVGHTQMDTNYYIMFTLGDTEQAQTKIWGLSGKANNRKFYADKSCSVTYTRPVN